MSKPTITEHDVVTGRTIEREMTDAEIEAFDALNAEYSNVVLPE